MVTVSGGGPQWRPFVVPMEAVVVMGNSNGSNFVGDSPTMLPDSEAASDISVLEWNEEMEELVSSAMEGMKGVLSEWMERTGVGSEELLVPSTDLWIPCRFFKCLVRSPLYLNLFPQT